MALSREQKEQLRRFYLDGGTRRDAREKFNLENSQMSGVSTQLGLLWNLSCEERRKSYVEKPIPQGRSSRGSSSKKQAPPTGRGSREQAQKQATSAETRKRIESVEVRPIQFDFSPESIAAHLYKAPPYKPGDEEK